MVLTSLGLTLELYFRNPLFLSFLLYYVETWIHDICFHLKESTAPQPVLLTHTGLAQRLRWWRLGLFWRGQSKEFWRPILVRLQVLGFVLF